MDRDGGVLLPRDCFVRFVRTFVESEHVGFELRVRLRATEVGEPAFRKLLLDLERDMEFPPLLGELEPAAHGPIPGPGAALDLEADLDRASHALRERRERVDLAFLTRGKRLAKLHAPVLDGAHRQQGAAPALGRVPFVERKLALGFASLVRPPALAAKLETSIGKGILGRLGQTSQGK
ncbi:MAG TPA: hypothetical protein PK640_08350 [Verrucomicrobiota bacterium]|nr:hypothetical protein [Verrucomicrobiota bacterium]